ncbi:MAG: pyridoxal-phosphate dependent enzyme [Proteobacteria bacterium]|nr:MAG: pyridoxal-phosphate dependent enzyme [Pseudomonadota bacterium]
MRNQTVSPPLPTRSPSARASRTAPGVRPSIARRVSTPPLHRLPALATRLGLAELFYKDESDRFDLKSFKAPGGANAVFRLTQNAAPATEIGRESEAAYVLSVTFRDIVSEIAVTCVTGGNHDRLVAWGAGLIDCHCLIFLHAIVSQGRCDAVSQYGGRSGSGARQLRRLDAPRRRTSGEERAESWSPTRSARAIRAFRSTSCTATE